MESKQLKTSGTLFILAGLAFFVAYVLGKQVAFIGVGAAFIGIGASYIMKSNNNSKN